MNILGSYVMWKICVLSFVFAYQILQNKSPIIHFNTYTFVSFCLIFLPIILLLFVSF